MELRDAPADLRGELGWSGDEKTPLAFFARKRGKEKKVSNPNRFLFLFFFFLSTLYQPFLLFFSGLFSLPLPHPLQIRVPTTTNNNKQDPKAGADEVYAAEEAKIEAAGKGKAAVSASASASAAATASAAAAASASIPAARDLKGDGDPLAAVEFSETAFPTGAVVPVRILGAFALIDEVRRKERDIDFFCQPSF